MPSEKPIGIFDSGIGGLTVAAAIKEQLPHENLIYFGDTAHLPYGDKSAETIELYSRRITEFLLEKECKAIVIACNTASSLAFESLRLEFGADIPIINVIDPTVERLLERNIYQTIGIIGTRATINSGVYQQKIRNLNEDVQVAALATPLLVPMIEEGFFNNTISKTIIHTYLEDPVLAYIDCLILACTHYPLIKKEIREIYAGRVDVIDSAYWVASALEKVLVSLDLQSGGGGNDHHFYISDSTPTFEQSAKIFFGKKIQLELVKDLI